ncbi:MAG: pilus (MSHA type) biogenesis protein MshL, partial [Gammaproteobacteria bacterium]|nr:pilus (MSHA type) biogenesis protein MshL [Gammaproteobacteria bacterium]
TALTLLISACAGPRAVDFSVGHVDDDDTNFVEAPKPVSAPPVLPKPEPVEPVPTYSVVVKDVPVTDLLFSLARDTGLELDIQADSSRTITINAVEQPLQQILQRIADQADLRFSLRGRNLIVLEDLPYWNNYSVDYVNVSRDSSGEVGVATQISTSGGSVGEQNSSSQQDSQGNLSKTTVKSFSKNDFWATLEGALLSIVKDQGTDSASPQSPQNANPVIVNRMAGIISVLATQSEHAEVQKHLDAVLLNSKRQVLIEMTIVEVELSDHYQAGVDWQRLSDEMGLGSNGISVRSDFLGPNLSTPPVFQLGYNSDGGNGSNISGTVKLLQQFGDTKVLSSPKIMALNNQTALLKVVNEQVYFTIELDIRDATQTSPERLTFTSEVHTVPVGLVLSLTPQISENGYVSLNIRPTISRITGFAVDPAPRLAGADFDNLIPEIQVREIESLLQVLNGQTIVLGGLMQNEYQSKKDGVPGLSRIPKIGSLFSYTSDQLVKTELVIFLRPTIVLNGRTPAGTAGLGEYYPAPAGIETGS